MIYTTIYSKFYNTNNIYIYIYIFIEQTKHIPSRYYKQVIQPQILNTKSKAIMIKPNYAT